MAKAINIRIFWWNSFKFINFQPFFFVRRKNCNLIDALMCISTVLVQIDFWLDFNLIALSWTFFDTFFWTNLTQLFNDNWGEKKVVFMNANFLKCNVRKLKHHLSSFQPNRVFSHLKPFLKLVHTSNYLWLWRLHSNCNYVTIQHQIFADVKNKLDGNAIRWLGWNVCGGIRHRTTIQCLFIVSKIIALHAFNCEYCTRFGSFVLNSISCACMRFERNRAHISIIMRH